MNRHFQKLTVFLLLMLVSLAPTVFAAGGDELIASLSPRGAVNDFAGVIDAGSRGRIESVATELRQKTGASIVVVTLKSMEGGEIDDFSNRLFEKWGIGQKGKDNGLLLLAAMEERMFRIEVGYGLEGIIPDSYAARVRRDLINPRFKAGRYGPGLADAVSVFASRIAEQEGVELGGTPAGTRKYARQIGREKGVGSKIFQIIIFIVIAIIFIRNPFLALLLLSGGRGGGFSGGGFGGGGMGGFGGGMSGGGGSSGGW